MENASKALLIAGGVLLAIMVVSLLILTFTKISDYQSSAQTLQKDSQLAQFNEQFVQYAQKDTKGTDLITLLNRVIDYNQKTIGAGDINYDNKITVKVILNGFQQKHHTSHIFTSNTLSYTVQSKNDALMHLIDEQRTLETTYSLNVLSALASDINSLRAYYETGDTQHGKSLRQVIGKEDATLLHKIQAGTFFDEIETHSEYANFKTSTFEGEITAWYPPGNSQVKEMTFRFKE